MNIISKSEKQTRKLGFQLAKKLKGGEIVCLFGELGSGKTVFAKGLAAGLGVKETITSPSFLLVKDYGTLVHIDLYRLSKPKRAELENIGLFEELEAPKRIIVIEWAERAKKWLKEFEDRMTWVEFEHANENKRRIKYDFSH